MKLDPKLLVMIAIVVLMALAGGDNPPVPPDPVPPPIPTPPEPVPPTPVLDSAPFQADSLTVLIVEETSKRHLLPASQLRILMSVAFRSSQQDVDLRIWDVDVDVSHESGAWRNRDPDKLKRESLPWLYVANAAGRDSADHCRTRLRRQRL